MRTSFSLAAALLLSSPAALYAADADAEAGALTAQAAQRLDEMSALEGEAWRAAKAQALTDAALLDELRRAEGTFTFTGATWKREAAGLALLAAARAPEALEALRAVKGVDPTWYLKARRPIPLATREVTRLDLSVGSLVDALVFEGASSFVKHPESAYPERNRHQLASLRAAEVRALEEGLLAALAQTRTEAAVGVLVQELQRGDVTRQRLALILLGDTELPRAGLHLVAVLDDSKVRGLTRASALVGLSKLRTQAAVERLLAEAMNADRLSDERLAAIRGLGNAGNRLAHKASPTPSSEAVRQAASDALLLVLPTVATDERLSHAVGEALAVVGHPSATTRLAGLSAAGQPDEVQRAAAYAQRLHGRAVARR